jgi:hypothetical protein
MNDPTAPRNVPSSLAGVLAALELDRPAVVTLAHLETVTAGLASPTSLAPATIAKRLRELGWLLPLRVRGAWEFAPADRAGAFSGGDPFIEVRALNVVRPDLTVGIGFESAAFLRSLASRQPTREVVVFEPGAPLVRAIDDFRRVDVHLSDRAYGDMGGLRVQTPAGIVAAIAVRPTGYADWPGLADWLPDAARTINGDNVAELLDGHGAGAWRRAAYLLKTGRRPDAAVQLLERSPAGQGPYYLGPRRTGGRLDAATQVLDTVLVRYADTGQEKT